MKLRVTLSGLAVAVRWTADAVGVVFSIRGAEYRAWVWASAVTPVQGP